MQIGGVPNWFATDRFDILTRLLSPRLGRMVVDQTGLSGVFDADLEWTPGPGEAGPPVPGGGPPPPGGSPAEGPSILTGLQEQLGLKLNSVRLPVEVLVIDRVEHPAEN